MTESPAVEVLGCPICGKFPITSSCVRDWLKVRKMSLHSEWQERMAKYANEAIRTAAQSEIARARREAIEECAKLTENFKMDINAGEYEVYPTEVAEAIRALAPERTSQATRSTEEK